MASLNSDMTDDVLNLAVGTPLQLQTIAPPDAPRYQVRTVGYLPGKSLVVTTPEPKGRLVILRVDQRFRVRMLRGESVLGFETHVLAVSNLPYPHVHLAYPKQVECIVVRNAVRVSADVPAVTRNISNGPDGAEQRVTLVDLSMTGAKLVAPRPLGVVGDMLHLSFEVDVAGKPEKLTLLGAIRNVAVRDRQREDLGYNHGIQFGTVNRYQQVLLHGWVLQQKTSREGAPG